MMGGPDRVENFHAHPGGKLDFQRARKPAGSECYVGAVVTDITHRALVRRRRSDDGERRRSVEHRGAVGEKLHLRDRERGGDFVCGQSAHSPCGEPNPADDRVRISRSTGRRVAAGFRIVGEAGHDHRVSTGD